MDNAAANLTASYNNYNGWVVTDSSGGVWYPSDSALDRIEAAADPAAEAVLICETEPMSGTWAA